MDNLIGKQLGHYCIDSLVGQGGMGAVYKATHITQGNPAAIKIMHPHLAHEAGFKERFLEEAKIAANLDHPNIVHVYDSGEEQSVLYMVMEFLPGETLRTRLNTLRAGGQQFDQSLALELMRQVCRAIGYAHAKGIVHRDIKPENIMLKPEAGEGLPYRSVLTDLGLARVVTAEHFTQPGISIGTPAYMSPEQARGQVVDARSDVYSLGVLLYELVVGHLPSTNRASDGTDASALDFPRAGVPEWVMQVIERALEQDRALRYASAGELAQALTGTAFGTATRIDHFRTNAPESLAGASAPTLHVIGTPGAWDNSVGQQFPVPDLAISQDGITILAPDHTIRPVPIDRQGLAKNPQGLKIGRGAENNVNLEDEQVSRQHAQVSFDGVNYYVMDLNSANGTFLSGYRLLPRVALVWTPEKLLQIGRHYIRLERSHLAANQTKHSEPGAEGGVAQAIAKSGRVGTFIQTTTYSVIPGESVTIPFTVLNQGETVDWFHVSVRGVPGQWLPYAIPPVHLNPNKSESVQLTIQPPRVPQSRAGQYPVTIRVTSQNAPDQMDEIAFTLTVEPYHNLSAQLAPEMVQAGKPAQVIVQNRGNTPDTYLLKWQDQSNDLRFVPQETRVTVPEGEEKQVRYGAKPIHRRWLGAATHPFKVQIESQYVVPQTLPGQLVSSGLIPSWVPPLLLTLFVIGFLCVLLPIFYFVVKPPAVLSLSYEPANPVAGQPVIVHWRVDNARTVELRPLLTDLPSQGEHTFEEGFPIPSNLTLVASNHFGTTEKPLTVAVVAPTTNPTPDRGSPVQKPQDVIVIPATPRPSVVPTSTAKAAPPPAAQQSKQESAPTAPSPTTAPVVPPPVPPAPVVPTPVPPTAVPPMPTMAVTNVTVSVSPASSSTCPTTFIFTGSITVNGQGYVTFVWEGSDGVVTSPQNLTYVTPGAQVVNRSLNLQNSSSGWQRVKILTPNSLVSNLANFTLSCPPTPTPVPIVYKTGVLTSCPSGLWDIDEGQCLGFDPPGNPVADFQFREGSFIPMNGAQYSTELGQVGYYSCKATPKTSNIISLGFIYFWFCMRTNSGRYSEFTFDASRNIHYTTWSNP